MKINSYSWYLWEERYFNTAEYCKYHYCNLPPGRLSQYFKSCFMLTKQIPRSCSQPKQVWFSLTRMQKENTLSQHIFPPSKKKLPQHDRWFINSYFCINYRTQAVAKLNPISPRCKIKCFSPSPLPTGYFLFFRSGVLSPVDVRKVCMHEHGTRKFSPSPTGLGEINQQGISNSRVDRRKKKLLVVLSQKLSRRTCLRRISWTR